jgi:hypothetical protein
MTDVDALIDFYFNVEIIDLEVVDIALDGMLMKDSVGCLVHSSIPLAHPSLQSKTFPSF